MKTIIDLITAIINLIGGIFTLNKNNRITSKNKLMTEKQFVISITIQNIEIPFIVE